MRTHTKMNWNSPPVLLFKVQNWWQSPVFFGCFRIDDYVMNIKKSPPRGNPVGVVNVVVATKRVFPTLGRKTRKPLASKVTMYNFI